MKTEATILARLSALRLTILALLLFSVTSCKTGLLSRVHQVSKPPYGNSFRKALQTASLASSQDGLPSLLQFSSKIMLRGTDLDSVVVARYAERGSFAIIDGLKGEAKVFSGNGAYVCTLGGRGNAPGQYLTPSDVIADGDGFTVVDFTMRRVSHFGADCKFENSFIYSPQGFAATRVLRAADGTYLLFGNRSFLGSNGHKSVDLLHRYMADGRFVGSSILFPYSPDPLNLVADDQPAVTLGEDGHPYFQMPFSTELNEIGSDGQVIPITLSLHLKMPKTPLDLKPDRMQDYWKWRLSWTPVVAVAVTKDLIWVECETFAPLRYTLEQFDRTTGRLIKSVNTNHLLLGRGPAGSLLFLDPLDNRGEANYGIDEFKNATI